MKRIKKIICLFLAAALVIGCVPAKRASAQSLPTDLPAKLTAATSTTATVTWNVEAAVQKSQAYDATLVGFRLMHWNTTTNKDVVVGMVSASTSSYTFRNMNPKWTYLLTIEAVARNAQGAEYIPLSVNLQYWPSRYASSQGGGSSNGVTPGNSGTDRVTAMRGAVSKTKLTNVGYYNYGFGRSKGLSVKWKGYTDVTGYQANLYNRKGKLVQSKTISNPYMNYCTFNKANTKNIYFVKIRCYYTYNGATTWSQWSANFNAVPQARLTSSKKSIKRHSIKLKWKKVSGATKYTIYARKGGKKKWTKVKTLKPKYSKYTFKKFKKKRITVNAAGYDVKVRTTGKVNGKKVNSTSYYYTNFYLI